RLLTCGVYAVVVGLLYSMICAWSLGADEPYVPQVVPDRKEAAQGISRIEFLPQPSGAEARILAALEEPTSIHFTEVPLQGVIEQLKAQHHIELQLDDKALDDAGIARDTPISLPERQGISLKSVLDLLQKKYGLCYLIDDETLFVTSKE